MSTDAKAKPDMQAKKQAAEYARWAARPGEAVEFIRRLRRAAEDVESGRHPVDSAELYAVCEWTRELEQACGFGDPADWPKSVRYPRRHVPAPRATADELAAQRTPAF